MASTTASPVDFASAEGLCIEGGLPPNALVQLQARYNHCGEASSEKVLVSCNVRYVACQEATLFQFNEYRSIEPSIAEPLASFFPPEYDNRLDLVRVQFVAVIQDWWSAPSIGDLNDGRFVVELDRQAESGRRRSPMFDKHNGMVHLSPRYHRRSVSTRDEEYAGRA